MPLDDLVDVSGHRPPMHAELSESQRIRLQGNAFRASDELTRRQIKRASMLNAWLVLATWALVAVTAVLVVVTHDDDAPTTTVPTATSTTVTRTGSTPGR